MENIIAELNSMLDGSYDFSGFSDEFIAYPSLKSIEKSEEIVNFLYENFESIPYDVSPDVMGGVGLYYLTNGHYLWLHIHNDGSVIVVVSSVINISFRLHSLKELETYFKSP